MFEEQIPTIVALTKGCKGAEVVRSAQDVPTGCGSTVLTPTVTVHILVRVSTTHPPLHNIPLPLFFSFPNKKVKN